MPVWSPHFHSHVPARLLQSLPACFVATALLLGFLLRLGSSPPEADLSVFPSVPPVLPAWADEVVVVGSKTAIGNITMTALIVIDLRICDLNFLPRCNDTGYSAHTIPSPSRL